MEVKPSPKEETDFVRVDGAGPSAPPPDLLINQLAAAGVAETAKLAAHLRACHLDERSIVTLDHEDLVEVLQSARQAGVSVGDRAKLKALVRRSGSDHTIPTGPWQHTPAPPSSPHAQQQAGPGYGAAAGPPSTPPAPKRLVMMYNQLVKQLVPLRVGVVELIDSVVSQYFAPALTNNSLWPRIVAFIVMTKGLKAIFKRRHGSSAFAAFLLGFFIRPRAVVAGTAEEAPSPAPAPAPAAE